MASHPNRKPKKPKSFIELIRESLGLPTKGIESANAAAFRRIKEELRRKRKK